MSKLADTERAKMTARNSGKDRSQPAGRHASNPVYDLLRRKIIRCDFHPGLLLDGKDWLEIAQSRRALLDDAILRLTYDGLIERVARGRYRVTALTTASIRDLFLLWRYIAPLMAHEAGIRMTEVARKSLASKVEKIARSSESASTDVLLRNVASVFDDLAALSGSPRLQELYDRLKGELQRVYTLFLSTPAGRQWASSLSTVSLQKLLKDASVTDMETTLGLIFPPLNYILGALGAQHLRDPGKRDETAGDDGH